MAHDNRYDVMLSSSFSYLNHKCSLIVRNVPKIPKNPEICHPKSSLTLTRDILSFEYGRENFFLAYERSTQGLLISGPNSKIPV